MTAYQNLSVVLRLDSARYTSEMRRAAYATNVFGQNIKGVGKSTGGALGAATSAATGFGLVIGGLGIAALKSATEFESAFTGVVKTVEGTEEQLDAIRTGILDMSSELPATAEEIAGVAEAAGQLGIATEDVLAFSKVMIDLGESTNLSAKDAATQLARFSNILQLPSDQFDNIGSSIVDLGNNFATTEAEIVDMSLRFAAAGQQAGLTAEDILGIATATSSIGVAAERGGTALSKSIFEINSAVIAGGADLEEFARIAGQSAEDFSTAWKTGGAAGQFDRFVKGLGEIKEEGEDVQQTLYNLGLRGVRVQQTLLGLAGAGDELSDAIERSNKASEENVALSEEANRRYATTASRLKVVGNEIKRAFIDAGTNALPDLLEVLERNADRLPALFENLAEAGVTMLDAFTAGLPVLETVANVLSKMDPQLLALVGSFGLVAKSANIFGRAIDGITGGSSAAAAAGGPLGIALAAVAAIGLQGISNGLDDMAARANATSSAISELAGNVELFVTGAQNEIQFTGLNEEDFALPIAEGGLGGPLGLGGAVDDFRDLTKIVKTLTGEYELSEDALKRVGYTQAEFVELALEGGQAVDDLGDRVLAGADFWGKWGSNAKDAVQETAEEIREGVIASLEDLVGQGVITAGALRQVRDAATEIEITQEVRYVQVLDDLGKPSGEYEQIVVDVETQGDEDLKQVTEDVRAIIDATQFASQAMEVLGVKGGRAAEVFSGFVLDENLLPDLDEIVDRLIYLADNQGDYGAYDLTGISDGLAMVVLEASAFSDVTDKIAVEARVFEKFRLNPDLTAMQRAKIIMDEFDISVQDVEENMLRVNLLRLSPEGLDPAPVDAMELAYGRLEEEMEELRPILDAVGEGFAAADTYMATAARRLDDVGVSSLSVKDALIAMDDADAATGGMLLRSLTNATAFGLKTKLLEGDIEGVVSSMNNLGYEEQEIVDIQQYLAESIAAVSEAYRSSIPTITGAVTEMKDSLIADYQELAEASEDPLGFSQEDFVSEGTDFETLFTTFEQQNRDAFDFTNNIDALRTYGFDDLAAAIVEISANDLETAQSLASQAVASPGQLDDFETRIERIRAGGQVLTDMRDEQASDLTQTSNRALDALGDKNNDLAIELAEAWGVTEEQIRDAIGAIKEETENLPEPGQYETEREAASQALTDAGYTGLSAAVALEADPSAFDDTLQATLLGIAGFDREQARAILQADDSQAAPVIAEILEELDLITAEEREAIVTANVQGEDEINALADWMSRVSQGVTVPIVPYITPTATTPQEANKFAAATGRTTSYGYYPVEDRKVATSQRYIADGSVLDFYAQGGTTDAAHVAQIAPAGSWRVWAEPETGGEAYIPLASSKRDRSVNILGEVARRFGYQLEEIKKARHFADGGLTTPQPIRSTITNYSDRNVVNNNRTQVSQPVNFHGDITTQDGKELLEIAERAKRRQALVGSGL